MKSVVPTEEIIAGIHCLYFPAQVVNERARPVILVPGAAGVGWMWKYVTMVLCSLGWPVYALSLPGHGKSVRVEWLLGKQKPFGMHTLGDYARALRPVVDTVANRHYMGSCILWGHSLGGSVVQLLADHPRVNRLVLLSSVAPRRPVVNSLDIIRRVVKYVPAMIFGLTFWYRREDYYALLCNGLSDEEKSQIFNHVSKESGWAVAQICSGVLVPPPKKVTVAGILIVSATCDRVTGESTTEALSKRYGMWAEEKRILEPHCGIFTERGAWAHVPHIAKWMEK